jgi:hypothetical protein
MNIFPRNEIFVSGFMIEKKWFLGGKMEIAIQVSRVAKWINAQFVSILTGRDFHPGRFMMKLCRSSDLM